MNFAQFKKSLGQVVQSAASTAKDLSSQVAGAKALRDYALEGQVATAGLNDVWKVYSARSRKEGAHNKAVSVWVVEKKVQGGGQLGQFSQPDWDAVLTVARNDATALTRLKHPAVVQVIEPMEETRSQLVMVTEPVFASAENLLRRFEGLPRGLMQARKDVKLSELEVKAGLLQVADALHFLHSEASLVHCALAPPSVVITSQGAWKLCGLALATRESFSTADSVAQRFDYGNSAMPLWKQLTQPQLGYTAPEVAGAGSTSGISPAADIFSLGCLAYELLSGRPLLKVGTSLSEYRAKLASISTADLSGISPQLQPTLQAMLAQHPPSRPPASAFAGCLYFQGDVVLRALRFLDTLLQRDDLQKSAFLKDLAQLWPQCDARVLRYRVLPALLGECRNEAMQPIVLPLVLRIAEQQEQQDFADYTLPALAPICASVTGEALLTLTRHAYLLAKAMPRAATATVLVPLLARAADQGNLRCQEEMLQQLGKIQEHTDYTALRQDLLPRAHRLALTTTSAAVRSAAFTALAALAGRFCETEQAEAMVVTMQQVTAVDKSAPTVSGCLSLSQALSKSAGARFAAERLIPVICPLLASPSTPHEQFTQALKTVRGMLDELEAGRGGAPADGSATSTPTHITGQAYPEAVWPAPAPPALNPTPTPSWGDPPPPPQPAPKPPPKPSTEPPPWTGLGASPAPAVQSSTAQPMTSSAASAGSPSYPPVSKGPTASSYPLGSKGVSSSSYPLGGRGSEQPTASSAAGEDPFASWPPMAAGTPPHAASNGSHATRVGAAGQGGADGDPFGFMGASVAAAVPPVPQASTQSSGGLFQDPSWQDPPLPGLSASSAAASTPALQDAGLSSRPMRTSNSFHPAPSTASSAGHNPTQNGGLDFFASQGLGAPPATGGADLFQGLNTSGGVSASLGGPSGGRGGASRPMSLQPPKLAPPPPGKSGPSGLPRTHMMTQNRTSATGPAGQAASQNDSLI